MAQTRNGNGRRDRIEPAAEAARVELKQRGPELPDKVLKGSVTTGDVAKYIGGGMVQFLLPAFGGSYLVGQLPPELPAIASLTPYNKSRDVILTVCPRVEGMWANAVHVATSKLVSRGIEFEGSVNKRVNSMNELFRMCDGRRGFAKYLTRHLSDFFGCSQGAFTEITRVKRSPVATITSFNHLDSLRVWRTGDPDYPAVYWDLRGEYHELRYYEVFDVTDMDSARAGWWYGGECAAERAYKDIRAVAAMTTYFDEKITGSGANKIVFVPGLNDQQLRDAIALAEQEKLAQGIVYYQGVYFVPLFGDQKIEPTEIMTKGMPDGWERKEEDQLRLLRYAKALGIVPQDLDPQLTARGALGVGRQSQVLDENERGYGFGTWEKMFLNCVNNWLMPAETIAALVTIDLRDEEQKAKNYLTRAQARLADVQAGVLDAVTVRYKAADDGDLPRELLEGVDVAPEVLTESNKPIEPLVHEPTKDQQPASPPEQGPTDPNAISRKEQNLRVRVRYKSVNLGPVRRIEIPTWKQGPEGGHWITTDTGAHILIGGEPKLLGPGESGGQQDLTPGERVELARDAEISNWVKTKVNFANGVTKNRQVLVRQQLNSELHALPEGVMGGSLRSVEIVKAQKIEVHTSSGSSYSVMGIKPTETGRGAVVGTFNERDGTLRLTDASSLETVRHELGHAVFQTGFKGKENFRTFWLNSRGTGELQKAASAHIASASTETFAAMYAKARGSGGTGVKIVGPNMKSMYTLVEGLTRGR